MDLEIRLKKIAEMENIPLDQFDVEGTQRFWEEHQQFELTHFGINLEYEQETLVAANVDLSFRDTQNPINDMIPEVSTHHYFYQR